MGDPFFDLANFSINHELDADGRAACWTRTPVTRRRGSRTLDLMRFMSDFREAMWGVVQSASPSSTSTSRLRREHFERMGRTASEPGFRKTLGI